MRNDFETGYLMHWGIKKGGKKDNHKYYERVEKNGKYLYFYTQAEYEAWLHNGNKALDSVKNKMKAAVKKPTFKNTRQKLLNALNVGRQGITNSIVKAQKTMTKSNAKSVIDRGNKAISSIINKTSSTVSKQTQNLQKSSKAASTNIQQRAKNIANNVSKTLQKAGKDTSKAVRKYVSKGEKTIKSILNRTGNTKVGSTVFKKNQKSGSTVLTAVLATVAIHAAVGLAAIAIKKLGPKVAKKVKEITEKVKEKIFPKKELKNHTTDPVDNKAIELDTKDSDFSSDAKDSVKENRAAHSDIPQKETQTSRDEDMENINPNYYEFSDEEKEHIQQLVETYDALIAIGDYEAADRIYDQYLDAYAQYEGYLQNCANCTLAYDLRRRGYDVTAAWNPNGTENASIADWYKLSEDDIFNLTGELYETRQESNYNSLNTYYDHKPLTSKQISEFEKEMERQFPEGAYGHLILNWTDGGGHDCVWSKENGKIVIRDCQSNEVKSFEEYASKCNMLGLFRADDKELTDKAYKLATAEKATQWGDTDYDDDFDDSENDFYYADNGERIVDYQDLAYDYHKNKKAAGRKKGK